MTLWVFLDYSPSEMKLGSDRKLRNRLDTHVILQQANKMINYKSACNKHPTHIYHVGIGRGKVGMGMAWVGVGDCGASNNLSGS